LHQPAMGLSVGIAPAPRLYESHVLLLY